MSYVVKEVFKTIQGEGANVGRVAVFCRFSGCNLWSGREEDRDRAICKFCDTDFINGKRYEIDELSQLIEKIWGKSKDNRFVVFTGGEPLLQLDDDLVRSMHNLGFLVAVETNGTILVPAAVDWVCVSPKAGAEIKVKIGSEIKFVFPQEGINPSDVEHLRFDNFFIQPMYGPKVRQNTIDAIQFCIENPMWRLSLQTHKMIGIR